jgi:hypothetical protein
MNTEAERIRALNDKLRSKGEGADIVITLGIHSLGANGEIEVIEAVQTFPALEPANDPYGEHDCALSSRRKPASDVQDRLLQSHPYRPFARRR